MDQIINYSKAAACIAAALAIGLGTLGPSLAQGAVGSKACENIGKYPESADSIKLVMYSAVIAIETSAIYALLIAGGLLYVALGS